MKKQLKRLTPVIILGLLSACANKDGKSYYNGTEIKQTVSTAKTTADTTVNNFMNYLN